MEWAASTLPDLPFHLMFQYVPDYRAARDAVLGRTLTPGEMRRARQMAGEIGVFLYEEEPIPPGAPAHAGEHSHTSAIGDTVDLLIHDDGRVSFTRLLGDLLPIAAALAPGDERVAVRRH